MPNSAPSPHTFLHPFPQANFGPGGGPPRSDSPFQENRNQINGGGHFPDPGVSSLPSSASPWNDTSILGQKREKNSSLFATQAHASQKPSPIARPSMTSSASSLNYFNFMEEKPSETSPRSTSNGFAGAKNEGDAPIKNPDHHNEALSNANAIGDFLFSFKQTPLSMPPSWSPLMATDYAPPSFDAFQGRERSSSLHYEDDVADEAGDGDGDADGDDEGNAEGDGVDDTAGHLNGDIDSLDLQNGLKLAGDGDHRRHRHHPDHGDDTLEGLDDGDDGESGEFVDGDGDGNEDLGGEAVNSEGGHFLPREPGMLPPFSSPQPIWKGLPDHNQNFHHHSHTNGVGSLGSFPSSMSGTDYSFVLMSPVMQPNFFSSSWGAIGNNPALEGPAAKFAATNDQLRKESFFGTGALLSPPASSPSHPHPHGNPIGGSPSLFFPFPGGEQNQNQQQQQQQNFYRKNPFIS
eukprot:TRINITY_DN1786_c0_g1_i2.p1 TRINITY_DN1786_c0_g1~~TRINITY_DN1786_c0_g1_i2.p1  ORF type:complete len:462 (+),score=140.68 TRINITY_DN1786_c0_g1_i2:1738-3123(+)